MSGGVVPGPGGSGANRGRNTSGGAVQSQGQGKNGGSEKIRVVVRVRPENEMEKAGAFRHIIDVVGEQMLVFDPKDCGSPSFYQGKARRNRNITKPTNRDMKFAFDRVFSSQDSTSIVYDNTLKTILDGLLDGYNCSVFAYGATGAGKTHTMLGSQENPGVIFRTMMDLYERIEDVKKEKTCDIAVSYLEVYNEQILDLLMPGSFLPVREDPSRGVVIAGLSIHKPHTAEELMQMLRVGNSNRTQHPTDANAESSRSHAVFQVFVRQRDRTGNTSADWNMAKMSLIDLAGSERATVTKNRGARFREGANINRSLLALGNCINALAEGKSKGYVPYRNSKLTRLLKDSLGGNCRTVMIAAVSPSSMTYEDTYNTLKYADRAKNIKVGLKKNIISVDLHVSRYVKLIEELRKEVTELKGRLESRTAVNPAITNGPATLPPNRSLYERLSVSLSGVFKGRIEIRKEMLELESSERDLSYKINRKELVMKRICLIANTDEETHKCLARAIESSGRRLGNIEKRRQGLQSRMNDNEIWLQQVLQEVENSRQQNPLAELLDADIRMRHLEVELRDTRRQAKYLKRLSRAQEREATAMEKLNTLLLQTVHNQYKLIKAHKIAGHLEESQYMAVQRLTCQSVERNVVWADQSHCPDDLLSISSTPTHTDYNPACGDFTVNHLLDFPILSCVPITPQRRVSGTPCNKRNQGRFRSNTPSSAKRKSRSPRKPFNRQINQDMPNTSASNPGVPLENGALPVQNLYKEVLKQSDLESVVREDDGVFPLQPTPPTTVPTSRLQSIPTQHPQTTPVCVKTTTRLPQQNHDSTATQLNNGSILRENINPQENHGAATLREGVNNTGSSDLKLSKSGSPTLKNSINTTKNAKNQPKLGATYEIPMKTGDGCPRMDKTHTMNTTYSETLNQTVDLGSATHEPTVVLSSMYMSTCGLPLPVVGEDTLTLTLPHKPTTTTTTHTPTPPHITTTTHQSIPTPTTPVLANATFNTSATVTKTVPMVDSEGSGVIDTGTVVKTKVGGVGGGTVTKCVHSNGNNVTPPQLSVVRSMDFTTYSSPVAVGRSFADALKTPPPKLQRLREEPVVRSPLVSRENLPPTNNHIGPYGRPSLAGCPNKPGQRAMRKQGAGGHQARSAHRGTDTLRKLGLPSILDHRKPNSGGSGTPGYMKNTQASKRRFRNHPRSTTSEGSTRPARLPRRILTNDENVNPAKRGLVRSKSVAALSSRNVLAPR